MSGSVKYRAWDKVDRCMAEALCIDFLNDLVDLNRGVIEREFTQIQLLQYTGLQDTECVEIYEDDILEVKSPNGVFLAKVVFEIGSYGLVALKGQVCEYFEDNWNDDLMTLLDIYWNESDDDGVIASVKVVGNIYENPDLLKGADE